MSDQTPVDLTDLRNVDAPEVVRPALKRFRRRVVLGVLVVATVAWGVSVALPDRKPVQLTEFEKLKRGLHNVNLRLIASGDLQGNKWMTYGYKFQDLVCFRTVGIGGPSGCQQSQPGTPISGIHLDPGPESQPNKILPYTAFSAVVPKEVRRVRIIPDRGEPVSLRTKAVPGISDRAVAGMFYRPVHRAVIEGYDSHNQRVPEPPVRDVLRNGKLTPEEADVAQAALQAGGDPAAEVWGVRGPFSFAEAMKLKTVVVSHAVDPYAPSYVVDLVGKFSFRDSPVRVEPPLELRAWFVVSPSGKLLSSGVVTTSEQTR